MPVDWGQNDAEFGANDKPVEEFGSGDKEFGAGDKPYVPKVDTGFKSFTKPETPGYTYAPSGVTRRDSDNKFWLPSTKQWHSSLPGGGIELAKGIPNDAEELKDAMLLSGEPALTGKRNFNKVTGEPALNPQAAQLAPSHLTTSTTDDYGNTYEVPLTRDPGSITGALQQTRRIWPAVKNTVGGMMNMAPDITHQTSGIPGFVGESLPFGIGDKLKQGGKIAGDYLRGASGIVHEDVEKARAAIPEPVGAIEGAVGTAAEVAPHMLAGPFAPFTMAADTFENTYRELSKTLPEDQARAAAYATGSVAAVVGGATGGITKGMLPKLAPGLKGFDKLYNALTKEVGSGVDGPVSKFLVDLFAGGSKTGLEFVAMDQANEAIKESAGAPEAVGNRLARIGKSFETGAIFHAVPTITKGVFGALSSPSPKSRELPKIEQAGNPPPEPIKPEAKIELDPEHRFGKIDMDLPEINASDVKPREAMPEVFGAEDRAYPTGVETSEPNPSAKDQRRSDLESGMEGSDPIDYAAREREIQDRLDQIEGNLRRRTGVPEGTDNRTITRALDRSPERQRLIEELDGIQKHKENFTNWPSTKEAWEEAKDSWSKIAREEAAGGTANSGLGAYLRLTGDGARSLAKIVAAAIRDGARNAKDWISKMREEMDPDEFAQFHEAIGGDEGAEGIWSEHKTLPIEIEDKTSFNGERQGNLLGPRDEHLVAKDPETGKDAGRLWVTKEDNGFSVRKVATNKDFERRGVASQLYDEAYKRFGPYRGATEQTADGKALVAGLHEKMPHIFPEDNLNIGDKPIAGASEDTHPTWYSPLERATDKINKLANKDGMVDPKQVKTWVESNAGKLGVKKAEIEHVGLPEYLDALGRKASVKEIKDFIKAGGVQIKEVEKGNETPWNGKDQTRINELHSINNQRELTDVESNEYSELLKRDASPDNPTKYSSYQLRGGKNYRELLLTLPTESKTKRPTPERIKEIEQEKLRIDVDLGRSKSEEERDRLNDRWTELNRESQQGIPVNPTKFQSAHWDEPNILAHIRFNERTDSSGKKILFVEEIQSDWGQRGKKEGFDGKNMPDKDFEELRTQKSWAWDAARDALDKNDRLGFDSRSEATSALMRDPNWEKTWEVRDPSDAEAIKKYIDLSREYEKELDVRAKSGISSGPFVTKTNQWTALAIQRMMRYATDKGFDKVAFVNGEQSAERYDLSKSIDELHYNPETHRLVAKKNGNRIIDEQSISPDKLEGYIGKEAAKKIMDQEPSPNGLHSLKGENLKVGGEGMKDYYDKILPSVAKRMAEKVGAKTSEMDMKHEYLDSGFHVGLIGGEWAVFKNGGGDSPFNDARFSTPEAARETIPGTKQFSIDLNTEAHANIKKGQPIFADNLGLQQMYETGMGKAKEALGLDSKATDGDVVRAVGEKIGKLGKTVAETAIKIVNQIQGIGRDLATAIAEHLHEAMSGSRESQRGAVGKDIGEGEFTGSNGKPLNQKSVTQEQKPSGKREETIARADELGLHGKDKQAFIASQMAGGDYKKKLEAGVRATENGVFEQRLTDKEQLDQSAPVINRLATRLNKKMSGGTAYSALKGIINGLNPAGASDTAMEASGLQAHATGKQKSENLRARQAFKNVEGTVDGMSEGDKYSLWHALETPGKVVGGDGELSDALNALKSKNDILGKELEGRGLIDKSVDNYVRRKWDTTDEASGKAVKQMLDDAGKDKGNSFIGGTGFTKNRVLDMPIEQAMKQYPGLKLKDSNPFRVAIADIADKMKMITGTDMLKEGSEIGLVKWYKNGEAPSGLKEIDDSLFRSTRNVDGKQVSGRYYADENVARVFNNYLKPGFEQFETGGKLYEGIRNIENAQGALQLGMSLFHGSFVTHDLVANQLNRALQIAIQEGRYGKAAITALDALASPITTPMRGSKLKSAILGNLTPKEQAAWAPVIDGIERSGMGVTSENANMINAIDKFSSEARKLSAQHGILGTAAAPFRHPLLAALSTVEFASKPLMEKYVPLAKAGAFAEAYGDFLRKNPIASEMDKTLAARAISKRIENRLGQVSYDNLNWNKFLKQTAFMAVRATGWDIGSVQVMAGPQVDALRAFGHLASKTGLMSSPVKAFEGGRAPWLTDRSTYLMTSYITTAISSAAFQMVAHALDNTVPAIPTSDKDIRHPLVGGRDEKGRLRRSTAPGYWGKEIPHLLDVENEALHGNLKPAGEYALGKMHPTLKTAYSLATMKDYSGTRLNEDTDSPLKMAGNVGKFVAKEATPFTVNSMTQDRPGLDTTGAKVRQALGWVPPTSSQLNTDAENYLSKSIRDRTKSETGREEGERRDMKRQALSAITRGDIEKYTKLIESGDFSKNDMKSIAKKSVAAEAGPYLNQLVENANFKELYVALGKTSDKQERDTILAAMADQIKGSRTKSPNELKGMLDLATKAGLAK